MFFKKRLEIIDYKIISNKYLHLFEKDVMKYLNNGWSLIGQPFYVSTLNNWYQTFVCYKK